jgi:hypothetical protein
MKATELRIGNYYYGCSRKQLEIVTGQTIAQRESGELPCMKGVPLTEEWLKKSNLNFEKLGYKSLGVSFGVTTLEIHFVIGNYYKKIKYLHELQNLYFEFTHEELTFKSE